MSRDLRPTILTDRRWAAAAAAALLAAISFGYLYHVLGKGRVLDFWEDRLGVMADDRQLAIETWTRERVADARLLASLLAAQRADGEEGAARSLELVLTTYGYSSGAVLGPEGRVLASAGSPSASLLSWARTTLDSPDGVDMISSDQRGAEVASVSPPSGKESDPVAVLAMSSRQWLYPLLGAEEALAPSVEALLVRREGDAIVFLSPLRFAQGDPMAYRLSLRESGLAGPARRALEGVEAFQEGTDYRGEPVLAVSRAIAGTPWGLVVKVDRREALASHRRELGWVSALMAAVLLAGGGLLELLARSRQVQVLRALHERDERYQTLVDTLQEGIVQLDHRDRIQYTNPALRRMLGYAEGELEGRSMAVLLPAERYAEVQAHLAERRRGLSERYEARLRRKDGAEVPVLVSATPLRDSTGAYAGSLAGLADLTQRKAAEARYQAFFEQAPDGIVVADADTGAHLEFNDAACEQLGYSREEFARLKVDDYHVPDEEGETPHPLSFDGVREHRQRRNDGEERIVQVSARRLALDERNLVQLIYRDVTDDRQQEARLMEGEKLAALGAMTAGIAHELNNPVMGLLGFIQYARRRVGDDSRLSSILGEAEETAERITRLVRDLLSVARGSHSDDARERVGDALERIRSLLSFRLKESGAELESRIPQDLPEVSVSADHLHQLLLNLIVNAIDAVEGGPQRQVRVEAEQRGREVVLSVSDTGRGMARSQRQRILEPFYTTKEVGKGTGLGLWIVHNLVEQHGGRLEVESRPGRGSTFRVILLVAEQERSHQARPAGST